MGSDKSPSSDERVAASSVPLSPPAAATAAVAGRRGHCQQQQQEPVRKRHTPAAGRRADHLWPRPVADSRESGSRSCPRGRPPTRLHTARDGTTRLQRHTSPGCPGAPSRHTCTHHHNAYKGGFHTTALVRTNVHGRRAKQERRVAVFRGDGGGTGGRCGRQAAGQPPETATASSTSSWARATCAHGHAQRRTQHQELAGGGAVSQRTTSALLAVTLAISSNGGCCVHKHNEHGLLTAGQDRTGTKRTWYGADRRLPGLPGLVALCNQESQAVQPRQRLPLCQPQLEQRVVEPGRRRRDTCNRNKRGHQPPTPPRPPLCFKVLVVLPCVRGRENAYEVAHPVRLILQLTQHGQLREGQVRQAQR